jgi:uncharacterized protein (TIGR02145 family)/uncharacterized repeat protein (TIGR02543 family)
MLTLALTLSCSEDNGIGKAFQEKRYESAGHVTDPRDGQTYRTVKIGNLTWTAENMNFETIGSRCYDGNGFNCDRYGRMYEWKEAFLSACPAGWHLPTEAEWEDLRRAVDNNTPALTSRSWGRGRDTYGWSALNGGLWNSRDAMYVNRDYYGMWWSSMTEGSDVEASLWAIEGDSVDATYTDNFIMGRFPMTFAMSVRCAKDDGSVARYTVKFDLNGGKYSLPTAGALPQTKMDDITVDGGKTLFDCRVSFYTADQNDGKRFAGWFDGDTEYSEVKPIVSNLTLKAKWVRVVRVTLDPDGGSPPIYNTTQLLDSGAVFTVLGLSGEASLTKPGFAFDGWFDAGGREYAVGVTPVTQDISVKARWRAVPAYSVSFNANGGAPATIAAVDVDSASTRGLYES